MSNINDSPSQSLEQLIKNESEFKVEIFYSGKSTATNKRQYTNKKNSNYMRFKE